MRQLTSFYINSMHSLAIFFVFFTRKRRVKLTKRACCRRSVSRSRGRSWSRSGRGSNPTKPFRSVTSNVSPDGKTTFWRKSEGYRIYLMKKSWLGLLNNIYRSSFEPFKRNVSWNISELKRSLNKTLTKNAITRNILFSLVPLDF